MASKMNEPQRITVSGTNWVMLNVMRRPKESFNDVITRVLSEREKMIARGSPIE